MEKQEIPNKVEGFTTAIEEFFAPGARLFPIETMKHLYEKVGRDLNTSRKGWTPIHRIRSGSWSFICASTGFPSASDNLGLGFILMYGFCLFKELNRSFKTNVLNITISFIFLYHSWRKHKRLGRC